MIARPLRNCPCIGFIFHQQSAPILTHGLLGNGDQPRPPWTLVSLTKASLIPAPCSASAARCAAVISSTPWARSLSGETRQASRPQATQTRDSGTWRNAMSDVQGIPSLTCQWKFPALGTLTERFETGAELGHALGCFFFALPNLSALTMLLGVHAKASATV